MSVTVTVPMKGDRHGGSITVPTPTLMDCTQTLRKLVVPTTLCGPNGKTRTCL